MSDPAMRVRNRSFAFEAPLLAGRWNDGDACLTHTFTVASLFLEVGERYMVESTAAMLPQVADAELRQRVKVFAGQESNHRHVHAAYNRMLAEAGFRVEPLLKAFGLFVRVVDKSLPSRWLLATLVSVEYLAALTSERAFDGLLGRTLLEDDSEVARFWRWHLAEEAEHRMVMHELYRDRGGSRAVLTITTWGLALALFLFLNAGMLWLALSGTGERCRGWLRSLFHYNFGRVGTALWLPARLLRASFQGFDPSCVCRHTDYRPHLDAAVSREVP